MEDPDFFYYAKFFLKPQAYSLDPNGNTWKLRVWANIVFFAQEIMVVLCAISVYFKYPDLEPMVTTVAVTIGLLINSFKIGTVHYKIETFSKFLEQLTSLWEIPYDHEKVFLMKHKKFTNVISVINFLSLTTGITCWLLMPVAIGVYETVAYGQTTWIPAWNITFLEVITVSPGYETLTLVNFVSSICCAFTGCGFDAYFLESCFFLSGHFKIIRERFRKIPFSKTLENSIATQRQIASTIDYHNKILRACEILEDIVRSGIFPFLLFDSILLCTIFYTVIMISGITYTVAFSGLACAALSQIGLLTYSGNYLYSRSQEVLVGIYDSDWYQGCSGQRKLIIPSMVKSTQGFIFKMGFFDLTLLTFSAMLQSAGSYVALIKSLSVRDE